MRIVHLADKEGNIKQRYVGFSFAFLFFGPFYLFANIRILSGILLSILYYYLLPIPGMNEIATLIGVPFPETIADLIARFLLFFRGTYTQFIGIALVVIIQICLSCVMEGRLIRKYIRKKYLPITEDDARLLISIHACNRKVPLAGYSATSSTDAADSERIILQQVQKDVPYILNDETKSAVEKFKESSKKRKIEELNDIYKTGQLTREEYEARRAHIINSYK